jgi:hypothetical protein
LAARLSECFEPAGQADANGTSIGTQLDLSTMKPARRGGNAATVQGTARRS